MPDDACTPTVDENDYVSVDCLPGDPEAFCIEEGYDDYNSGNGECYYYD